jgi:hypothetical protein
MQIHKQQGNKGQENGKKKILHGKNSLKDISR